MNWAKALRILVVLSGASVLAAAMPQTEPPSEQNQALAPAQVAMKKALEQSVANYALREKTASAAIKQQLSTLRQQIREKNLSFEVGYTTAADVPLEMLAGTKVPHLPDSTIQQVNALAERLEAIDQDSAAKAKVPWPPVVKKCSALHSFDWRKLHKVTPVRSQICGTCWDFTAMGAYEGSYALRNNALVNTSEQYVLNCANAGSCQGGWWMPVFDYLITHGTATEQGDPFTGNDQLPCPANVSTPYRATAWAFVGSTISDIPPVANIKQALCKHGPLATAVFVDTPFQYYTGGVFDEHTQQFNWINHGVTIIGWDDAKRAWLIKNSWGPGWGATGSYGASKGYMWIAYNTNNIGIATAWVNAVSRRWILLPDWMRTLEERQIKVHPLPPPPPVKE